MGARTTILILDRLGEPKESAYWHWWHDDLEGISGELADILSAANECDRDNLGSGDMAKKLRTTLPQITIQRRDEINLDNDVAFRDDRDVIGLASSGEVCVVIQAGRSVSLEAVLQMPTVAQLRALTGRAA